jgi:hypothetical protein
MIRVLADGIIYGKQARGGVGRLFEESFKRFGQDASYGVDVHLMLPEKIQRLPDDLAPAEHLHHVPPAKTMPGWAETVLPERWRERVKRRHTAEFHGRLRRVGARLFHSTYYTAPPY